ncbi:MAG: hypothetical protein DRP84_03910 [Spirochaetes bacterium]|nr:MAG: hypothetical protein DRP84_03910 [Spirochaetota bacterium]
MKKLLLVLLGLIMIFSLVFLFSGCDLLKNTVENLMKDAELASKALSDSGYKWYNSNPQKDIQYEGYGDISGSHYASEIGSNLTSSFLLTFNDEPVPVTDENGNPVTVTLNGTVNFGISISSDTFKMVIYSSDVNIKVGDDDMGSVPVDLYFYFSTSLTATTVSATIEGNVGNYTVNTSLTVNVPSI